MTSNEPNIPEQLNQSSLFFGGGGGGGGGGACSNSSKPTGDQLMDCLHGTLTAH